MASGAAQIRVLATLTNFGLSRACAIPIIRGMSTQAELHPEQNVLFSHWVQQERNLYLCWVLTPTHLMFVNGQKKRMKAIGAAVEAQDNASLLSIKGAKLYERSTISSLRFVPDKRQMQITCGDVTKKHIIWVEAFERMAWAMPEAPMQEEDFTSTALKADRFALLLPLIGLTVAYWIAPQVDSSSARRYGWVTDLLESIDPMIFYPVVVLAAVAAIAWAIYRNGQPTESYALHFTAQAPSQATG